MGVETHHEGLRGVGATPVSIPAIGFGGAAIGNLYRAISDEGAQAAIAAALQAGISYFDTAPHYGFGLSETRLGAGLKGRSGVRLSTKVGRRLAPIETSRAAGERHGFVDAEPYEPVFDYSHDGVMASFEASLQRLGVERVDILLAHDLGALTHGEAHSAHFRTFLEGGYRAMRELKADGCVGAIGIGVNEIDVCLQVLNEVEIDAILLAGRYTLLEQAPLAELLPECARRGVSVIVGGPFNSGILAAFESGRGSSRYNYEAAPREVVERVERLALVCAAHGTPLAAAAVQFPLAHPCVVSVLAGLASPGEVADLTRALAVEIPADLWDELKADRLIRQDAPTPAARANA
jgi:D-threo-aldose 1-dehydrogenase